MEFRLPYVEAMREQAPRMFNELQRSGQMGAHLEEKGKEAARLYSTLTRGRPREPGGAVAQPYRREAEEQVLSLHIDFPQRPDTSPQQDENKALFDETPTP
jgi:hypothetical protein